MNDNVLNLNENAEDFSYVISLLDFLRSLPSVFDLYMVVVTSHSWRECSVCHEEGFVVNKEYSFSMPLMFFRRTVQDDSCSFPHLSHPDFYNHLFYEFIVRIEKQMIFIDYYDFDYKCDDYVCEVCGSDD